LIRHLCKVHPSRSRAVRVTGIRCATYKREMVLMRCGMPPSPLPLVGGLPFASATDRELAL
jgi:hypothetical protein